MITPFRKKEEAEQVSTDMQSKQERFDKLVKGLYTDVFRYAYWLCGERAMAEDLVQETFLRAWRALDSLKDERAAKAWLITIVRRENARQYERYRPTFVDIETQEAAGAIDGPLDADSYALRKAMTK
ncbi:MAG: sigma-70 family RNA polymerase sigma factor, partial [Pseudomonadota bacterium]